MPPEKQRLKLEDVLSYTPESYFDEAEIDLIRATFNGAVGAKLIKVLRKTMIPTIADPELPIEEVGKDAWLTGLDATGLAAEHLKPIIVARQDAIKFIIGGLIQLKQIANIKEETPQNRAARRAQDSVK